MNFIDIKSLLDALCNTVIALTHEPAGQPLLNFSMNIAIPVPSDPPPPNENLGASSRIMTFVEQ